MEQIQQIRTELISELAVSENPASVLKSPKIKDLYKLIPTLGAEEKVSFGAKVNDLRNEIQALVEAKLAEAENAAVEAIDVTAPFAENGERSALMSAENGSVHPLQRTRTSGGNLYSNGL